jgi:hypothetical protein
MNKTMRFGVIPMVLRMAISAFLSVTTMTIIETILKAATAIINDNIIAILPFSEPLV